MNMRMRQARTKFMDNPNELWMQAKLDQTGHKWTRQVQWGYRIFDFWSHKLGLAVEVDGPEHYKEPKLSQDKYRDEYNYRRSAIVVLRVRNRNEEDAAKALDYIAKSCTWKERRASMNIEGRGKIVRKEIEGGALPVNQFTDGAGI